MQIKGFPAPYSKGSCLWLCCALPALLVLLSWPMAYAAEHTAADNRANRIVSGILSFTRWPPPVQVPQLCILASARHLTLSSADAPPATPFSVVRADSAGRLSALHCDAVYFGTETPAQQHAALAAMPDKAVLSMAENNPDCATGATFCMIFGEERTRFSVNLDSLARSGVKVSPDVLMLSRKENQ
ncbi:DUF4154 domain-containing protein [Pantoea sp. ICBG 1758]|jgi:hypothetical protein|uniref:YfiR family protein n=1 Tax=Pantoea eucrina TaxID=472693 RepID=A0ABS1Z571_9GAMM|nr:MULTISPECIES: YfiR family protein [Pantoea]AJA71080.1 hypothetical protein PSNIH1_p01035 [Pantoea sp. PSNIH1]QNH52986.1 YfiR family protein [Acinetobacter venetianus]RBO13781.1 YfiR family protein [Pantoea sp. 3_1284]KAA6044290.1 YfiR family protein [Pantoea sp. Bo_7]KAA6090067.1 YfiR family protein [Pantoea sp. Bo_10]